MPPGPILPAAAFLLAGCASAPPEDPMASASATPSAGPLPPAPHVPAVYVGSCSASSGVAFGVSGLTQSSLSDAVCPFAAAYPGDGRHFTAALGEATWTPQPGVTGAVVLVQSDHCKSEGHVDTGGYHSTNCNYGLASFTTSPARFVVAADKLAQGGNDNMTASLSPSGASTSQAFTIYVTLFEGPMPAGYSALA